MEKPSQRRDALAKSFPKWEKWTLFGIFDSTAARFPDRPAILLPERSWTYAQLQQTSCSYAAGLIALGLAVGDRVAMMLPNIAEFVPIKLAIARAGCIAVPVNFLLRREEMLYIARQSGCRAIFGVTRFQGRDYTPDFAYVRDSAEMLEHVILATGPDHESGGGINLTDLLALATPAWTDQLPARQMLTDADCVSDIVYTSGTTGQPKGAMLTHDMVLRAAYSSALTRSFEDGRRIQFALPMYHVFGYVECWVASMLVGGAIVPHPRFDAAEMLEWCVALETTDIVAVPVMTRALIDAARVSGFAPPCLLAVFNSGGVNAASTWHDIRKVLGAAEIHTAYGMTETTASAVCTLTEDSDARLIATNGRLKLAGVAGDPALGGLVAQYRVVDPQTGVVLAAGEVGELQVRGPIVTKGYFHKPEEDAAAFTPDGWFRTGDLGCLFADGYLKLTGRIKESYRCGGEMVMPREIEDLFDGYPGVSQVLAVGVPDVRMGEAGCLCVVPLEGTVIDSEAMRGFCAARLAKFKVPKHVLVLEQGDIPLTPTGRPQKFRLSELAARRLGLAEPI